MDDQIAPQPPTPIYPYPPPFYAAPTGGNGTTALLAGVAALGVGLLGYYVISSRAEAEEEEKPVTPFKVNIEPFDQQVKVSVKDANGKNVKGATVIELNTGETRTTDEYGIAIFPSPATDFVISYGDYSIRVSTGSELYQFLVGLGGGTSALLFSPLILLGELAMRMVRSLCKSRAENLGQLPSDIPQDIISAIRNVLSPAIPFGEEIFSRLGDLNKVMEWLYSIGVLPKPVEAEEVVQPTEPVPVPEVQAPVTPAPVTPVPLTSKMQFLNTIYGSNEIVLQARNPMENVRLTYVRTESGSIMGYDEGTVRVYKIEKLPSDETPKQYLWIDRDLFNRLTRETAGAEERYYNYRWQVRGNTLYLCKL